MSKRPSTWQVVFYTDSRGNSPIVEFLSELTVQERAEATNAFHLLREFGILLGMPHARPVVGKLWELRPGPNRFFYFAHSGRQLVILHGYRKKSQKAPKKEIAIAERRMRETIEEM